MQLDAIDASGVVGNPILCVGNSMRECDAGGEEQVFTKSEFGIEVGRCWKGFGAVVDPCFWSGVEVEKRWAVESGTSTRRRRRGPECESSTS